MSPLTEGNGTRMLREQEIEQREALNTQSKKPFLHWILCYGWDGGKSHSESGNLMDISGILEHLHLHEMLLLLKVVTSLLHVCSASAEIISSIYCLHQKIAAHFSSALQK